MVELKIHPQVVARLPYGWCALPLQATAKIDLPIGTTVIQIATVPMKVNVN